MIIPVASIGYNRPELQELSLEYLARCSEAKQTPLHLFIDHGMSVEQANELREKFLSSFATVELHYLSVRSGLSRNIAGAMKFMMHRYPICCILEDDVLCSKDFFRFHVYIQENIDLTAERVLTVSAYTKDRLGEYQKPEEIINKRTWYSPDGVVLNVADWNLIKPHFCEEYFLNQATYLQRFYEACKKHQPRFAERCWPNGKRRWVEQAGLINTIRASLNMYSIIPEVSRCQDIGVYGKNHQQKIHNGEDIRSEAFWRTGGWYSKSFEEDHDWRELRIGSTERVFLG